MNSHRLATASALALVTCVTVACDNVPLLPKWDADWYVPLPSQGISLLGPFPGAVPPGTSANVSFPPQRQSLDGAVGAVLDQQLNAASLIVTISKTAPVSGNDTVFVAADSASLSNSAATRIVVPLLFLASDVSITDTVVVQPSGVTMLRNAAQSKSDLWVQLRGRASYAGPGILTVTPSDSIHVRLALLATIAVSR